MVSLEAAEVLLFALGHATRGSGALIFKVEVVGSRGTPTPAACFAARAMMWRILEVSLSESRSDWVAAQSLASVYLYERCKDLRLDRSPY